MGYQLRGQFTDAWLTIDDIDGETLKQIYSMINHPAFVKLVAIMPDTHVGKGAVVGFTMEIGEQIVPGVVGVDIGCGILAAKVGKLFDDTEWEIFDYRLRKRVPTGGAVHNKPVIDFEHEFPWEALNAEVRAFVMGYYRRTGISLALPTYNADYVLQRMRILREDFKRMKCSLGTLGGGNHFVEVGKDSAGEYWISIHTGSRHLGQVVCDYHRKRGIVPPGYTRDLAYIEGDQMVEYCFDMIFAQFYARLNRRLILRGVLEALKCDESVIRKSIESTHNYIDFKDWIIRKGAISAYVGEELVIPFNMRDGMLICRGLSNEQWNCSAPHGAGRVLSRSRAKKEVSLNQFKKSMKGIYSSSVCRSTIDESPFAYKDTEMIKEAVQPTVDIIDQVIPVFNMKDAGSCGEKNIQNERKIEKRNSHKRERSRGRYYLNQVMKSDFGGE